MGHNNRKSERTVKYSFARSKKCGLNYIANLDFNSASIEQQYPTDIAVLPILNDDSKLVLVACFIMRSIILVYLM